MVITINEYEALCVPRMATENNADNQNKAGRQEIEVPAINYKGDDKKPVREPKNNGRHLRSWVGLTGFITIMMIAGCLG